MERVTIYLRKSRTDLEAEARGEGETLAKHKRALLKTAKQMKLNIVRIFEEIETGERIVYRPKMMELLRQVENDEYDAVLVMDLDRLARGKSRDYELIIDTFKETNTKIITPRKTYDLNDEMDEEFSEFEFFMARKEYKIITRRLQRGRLASIEEGNYLGNVPPYGYNIVKTSKGNILEPHPDQAPVVKMMYDMYLNQKMGTASISRKLNDMGIPTAKNKHWVVPTVRDILQNPVYIGKIKWKSRPRIKDKNSAKMSRPRANIEDWVLVDGKHQPIIDEKTFYKTQEIFKTKYRTRGPTRKVTNPLAGIIKCGKCGSSMFYRPYSKQAPHIICTNQLCDNKSSQFKYVEEKLFDALKKWLEDYKAEFSKRKFPNDKPDDNIVSIKKKALKSLEKELLDLEVQKGKLHDLLERGIYDEDTFIERSQNLALRIEDTRVSIEKLEKEIKNKFKEKKAQKNVIPMVEKVLDLYKKTDDPEKRNDMLKAVLNHAVYTKEKHQQRDNFTLVLYPKLPQHR